MVILLNCVTLGMYQPCENIDCTSDRCQILQAFDAFIYIFFALEMVIKMVALGIFGRRCYLGDTWNRLDFFIVMAGMVEYSLDLQNINLSAIRDGAGSSATESHQQSAKYADPGEPAAGYSTHAGQCAAALFFLFSSSSVSSACSCGRGFCGTVATLRRTLPSLQA
ncbi:hypothetical protein OJAV_G00077400 [Oryzias javanicus]|uniref:Ion transport domain-containing protein n=1 Tax=Oryzias javanicus TaxID=123683 RepID=A0A437D3B6_ORYJA|nr:hypothetical protein OJAV_G00077400 [Oryzias javanicus]